MKISDYLRRKSSNTEWVAVMATVCAFLFVAANAGFGPPAMVVVSLVPATLVHAAFVWLGSRRAEVDRSHP